MSRKGLAWMFLVFGLTLLAGLPAGWLLPLAPWPTEGVSGSLWQGRAVRLGQVGAVTWRIRPWATTMEAGYQAQRWRFELQGWPWAWQATLGPSGPSGGGLPGYRLNGEWQGQLQLRGTGGRCVSAAGQVAATELALVAPWSLPLGHGEVRIECDKDWRLQARLHLAGQHQALLRVGAQGAVLEGRVEQGAALYPVLLGAQWLAPGTESLRRTFKW